MQNQDVIVLKKMCTVFLPLGDCIDTELVKFTVKLD